MSPRAIGWAVPSLPPSNTLRFSWTFLSSSLLVITHQTWSVFICMQRICHFKLTKLPLAETRDPKWRSWWVPDVSVHLFTSGLYLARWIKVTETTEIMPDLMILIWSWACCSTHCQHWLSCCVLLTPPHASTFPPIQAATSPRLDRCDYSVVCFGLY